MNSKFTFLQRKLQCLAVVAMLMTQVGSFVVIPTVFAYFILFTSYWWIFTAYICWYLIFDADTPERGERRSEWVRSWAWWCYVRDYFPAKLVKLPWGELDHKRNYMFCVFPHGLFSFGAFLTLATNAIDFHEIFPHHKPYIHTISVFFKLPLIRELGFWIGGLTASRKSIDYVLGNPEGGNVSGVIVGGAAEAFNCKPGVHRLVLKKRKGFVRLALKHGSPLVPVYCFGETDLYSQLEFDKSSYFIKIQQFIKRITGFAVLIPIGRSDVLGILPNKCSITTVVGKPIDVPKLEDPTEEQVDELHKKFEKELVELFESQKKIYLRNSANIHLEIM